MTILVLAEHDNNQLSSVTSNVVNAASKIGSKIDVLVAGFECQTVAESAAKLQGVQKVLLADKKIYEHQLAETMASLLNEIVPEHYSHVLASASSFGKSILPRLAAQLDVAQLSSIVSVISDNTFVRPIYAGNALETVLSTDRIKIITVRSVAFNAVMNSNSAEILKLDNATTVYETELLKRELSSSKRPHLCDAKIIVSGGRGLESKEKFQITIEPLADKLGAAIGASRAAVDAEFVPGNFQVGQTGQIVAPGIYIAIGISGAIQHLAGIKDSQFIIAINKDPNAMIFKAADIGLVADLFDVIPEIIERL